MKKWILTNQGNAVVAVRGRTLAFLVIPQNASSWIAGSHVCIANPSSSSSFPRRIMPQVAKHTTGEKLKLPLLVFLRDTDRSLGCRLNCRLKFAECRSPGTSIIRIGASTS